MKLKKLSAMLLAMAMLVPGTVCHAEETEAAAETTAETTAETAAEDTAAVPKYIFLFIGDGMSYPQVQTTNYYLSAMNDDGDDILTSQSNLNMMNFPVAGSAQTYDSTSFCPDSASTATSISTGHKTYSGTINMDETGTTAYETIAEKLKEQKDYKIGVLTSVNLNHATPAAFYAHQASRSSYYEIGLEMIDSGFDYFAGGALLQPTGSEEDQTDLYELASEAGYTVVKTQAEAEALTADSGKVVVIDEHLADDDAMSYDMDLEEGMWSLADYVDKGIEMLDNETGFFMMVEGGKIDWACHANDAASTINDTIALDEAIGEAVEFYNEHPDETLILVTGDHETGGLTIGFAGTDYDTFLTNLSNQKISYAKYDSDYVASYKENGTDFETVMADITELFGLEAPQGAEEQAAVMDSKDQHPESNNTGTLVMTDYEYEKLQAAYEETMSRTGEEEIGQEEYILYGSYEPLTVTITHILNNKSGINFASYAHTGLPVPVFAQGVGQDQFEGYYDNTDIYNKMAALTGVE
ncbi:MAG TPA: alkaline phosphatase [Candidatus Limivivens intestinipullorum]|uniref:Alkaline phosphatase n=1 Tax=Candidatus Limivivens intestinipullorum TaxID=2840858 RepID=A0A9D1EV86_9FIRM|nr:alkaline phosphatase [Candidatus Limivivens intestinipullorum]